MAERTTEPLEEVTKRMADLSVLSFRKLDEVKKLARHFKYVLDHPETIKKPQIHRYLSNLNQTHRDIFLKKRDDVVVEYVFTTEKKSGMQRQRFNSLPVSEVPEILKAEYLTADNAKQVHICTDCNVEIDLSDDVPLMESLQRHFNLEQHKPRKRESVDVSEPISLPKMTRRMSAIADANTANTGGDGLDKNFIDTFKHALKKLDPKGKYNDLLKAYEGIFKKLSTEVSHMDFSQQILSVAPIIMSIKDNVNQNFTTDPKQVEIEDHENEKTKNVESTQYRYYGPIEKGILELLEQHKLLCLTDDRTGKTAFFCIACEYYTLRFRYDSVLNHIFSDMHLNNVSSILKADPHIPFDGDRAMETFNKMNLKFLRSHNVLYDGRIYVCNLCRMTMQGNEAVVMHILEETHLAKLADKNYSNPKSDSEEWSVRSLDWIKHLASRYPRPNMHVFVENSIKTSKKSGNYCVCCDMTLKGPRQMVFSHARQKKHVRYAAPYKLTFLYRNHFRPAEYYASFGNFYLCTVCPGFKAFPSFAAIHKHKYSMSHIENLAKIMVTAEDEQISRLFDHVTEDLRCEHCNIKLDNSKAAVKHILGDVDHATKLAEAKVKKNRTDMIGVYFQSNFITHTEGSVFTCKICNLNLPSIRSLLDHLVFAEHVTEKIENEDVFRFYLEMKHNINMLARNKYSYYDFGKVRCGVCDVDLKEDENMKKHVCSQSHRDNMGVGYHSITLDNSINE